MPRPRDREILSRLDGMFVGQLDAQEMAAFNRACAEGWAKRVYEGGAGFLGLARVRLLDEAQP